jgi:hypothetical protein
VVQQRTLGASISTLKYNFTATVAPSFNNDSDDGYEIGSRWIDETNDKEYVALDVTIGSAIWTETTQSGGAGAVSSVFGRTGAVIAATGDYDAFQVDYGPGNLIDWDSSLDPGQVQNALDQLAERITDLENENIFIDQSGGTSDTYGVLSGAINGSNTTFTTSQSSYDSGTLLVFLNGQLQIQGSGEDWTETTPASGTFDFATAPVSGDELTIFYQTGASINVSPKNTISGTAGEALSLRDYVYLRAGDNKWYKVDIDATVPVLISGKRGFVTSPSGINIDETGEITLLGSVRGFSGLTAGQPVYGASIAGTVTQIKPTPADGGTQVAIVQAATALTATELDAEINQIIYAKRETLANNGELEIEHHDDSLPFSRRVFADEKDVSAEVVGGDSGGTGDANLFPTAGTNEKLAQSFIVPGTGSITVTAVSVRTKLATANSRDVDLRIETDSSGEPSGSLVDANAEVSHTPGGTSYSYDTETFAASFTINLGTQYWLVYSPDYAANGTDFVVLRIDNTDIYADGELYTYNGSTWSAAGGGGIDTIFAIVADAGEEQAVVGRFSAGTRDVGVRKDGATKTTFKNVTGGNLDVECKVQL